MITCHRCIVTGVLLDVVFVKLIYLVALYSNHQLSSGFMGGELSAYRVSLVYPQMLMDLSFFATVVMEEFPYCKKR